MQGKNLQLVDVQQFTSDQMDGSSESHTFVPYRVSRHIDVLLKLYFFVLCALYLYYVNMHGMCRIENMWKPNIISETADREPICGQNSDRNASANI